MESPGTQWFGVSSSVLHERFQTWGQQGVWQAIFQALLRFYARQQHIRWQWQSVDSRSCAAPLGGSDTGANPTDRAKLGSKVHILVDQRVCRCPFGLREPISMTNGRWMIW